MGRRPRFLIAGGIYHVYNRVSRGARVFRDDEEADRLEALFAADKQRDEFQILACCIMSNHYHLAVRMGEVTLSRSMRTVHQQFALSFNGRHRVFGPFWQGRYRSRLVVDSEYLTSLIASIHLNPVTAGVVTDASNHRSCGHREALGRAVGRRLVDVDKTLLAFDEKRRSALAGYRSAISSVSEEEGRATSPGGLPWWRADRPLESDGETELVVDEDRPRIQISGLSNAMVRPRMEIECFLENGARACRVTIEGLRNRRRSAPIVEARETLVWLEVELYGFKVKEMAQGPDRYVESASRLVSRAAELRVGDRFANRVSQIDAEIAGATETG